MRHTLLLCYYLYIIMPHPTKSLKQYLPALLLLLPATVWGKAKKDTIMTKQGVEIFVKSDQSKKLKIIAELHLLDAEAGASDFARIGAGFNADYIHRKYFSVNASYKTTFYSFLQQSEATKSYSDTKLNPFSVGSAGVRLHIMDGKGWEKRKMTLDAFKEVDNKGQRRTTMRFTKARFPCRRIFALRGGGYYSTAPISTNMTADIFKPQQKGSLTTTDGTVFGNDYYTNTRTMGFYGGLTRLTHMKMKTTSTINWFEGEAKQTAIFKEVYADVIFANTTIDPLLVNGKEYAITPNAPGSFSLSDIGWRIGGRLISTRKRVNMGTSYELGSRPGLKQRGAYLAIGITLAWVK